MPKSALNLGGPKSRKYSSPFKHPIPSFRVNEGGFTLGSKSKKVGLQTVDLTFGLKIASSDDEEHSLVLGRTRFGGNMLPH